jgi:hypothetical protein
MPYTALLRHHLPKSKYFVALANFNEKLQTKNKIKVK